MVTTFGASPPTFPAISHVGISAVVASHEVRSSAAERLAVQTTFDDPGI
jgi:hypothetical protein